MVAEKASLQADFRYKQLSVIQLLDDLLQTNW